MKRSALLMMLVPLLARGADWPQWGHDPSRNPVSEQRGLPVDCEPGKVDDTSGKLDLTGARNTRWAARMGDHVYGNPVVAGGKVLVGTNNESPRDPRIKGDYSLLLCLDEATGKLDWQLSCPKLLGGNNADWSGVGLCSSPAIDVAAGRVYVVTNRCEVLCLDLKGQSNGNDGPFQDEAQYMAGPGKPPIPVGPTDADIIWRYDMRDELGVYAFYQTASSVLLVGDKLYATTSNSRDWSGHIPMPDAPALICLDAKTGKLLGQEASGISSRTFVSNWSSPAYGKVGNQDQVIFGGGDGWVYGFAAQPSPGGDGTPILKELWRFDANPPGHRLKDGKPIKYGGDDGPREVLATPVFHDGKVYAAIGKNPDDSAGPGLFSCIDASKTGDITTTGRVWQYDKCSTSSASPAIVGDLMFTADSGGFAYCFDANTGALHWKHDMEGKVWGSPLAADGKVYLGSDGGTLVTFALSKEKKILGNSMFDGEILSSPVAANGTIFVATSRYVYAISEKK